MFYQKIINFTPLEKSRRSKKPSFWHSLTGFVKYHNAFTIGLLVLFIISTVVFANEDVRDGVIGKEVKEIKGVNNEALLELDLADFDLAMQIINIQEDEEKFYIDYTFKTFEIKDNVWQEVAKDQVLTIDKKALANRDLGMYIAKELGEVADSQMSYLSKIQIQEKEKGQTMALETIDWTGLIGLVMSPKTKELMGYTPELEKETAESPWVFQGEGSIQPEIFSAGQAAQKLLEIKRQEEQERQRLQRENAAQNNNGGRQAAPVAVPLPAEVSTQAGAPSGAEEGATNPAPIAESSNNDAESQIEQPAVVPMSESVPEPLPTGLPTIAPSEGASEVLPPDTSLDTPSEQLTLPPAE